jgi:hypothetical protein
MMAYMYKLQHNSQLIKEEYKYVMPDRIPVGYDPLSEQEKEDLDKRLSENREEWCRAIAECHLERNNLQDLMSKNRDLVLRNEAALFDYSQDERIRIETRENYRKYNTFLDNAYFKLNRASEIFDEHIEYSTAAMMQNLLVPHGPRKSPDGSTMVFCKSRISGSITFEEALEEFGQRKTEEENQLSIRFLIFNKGEEKPKVEAMNDYLRDVDYERRFELIKTVLDCTEMPEEAPERAEAMAKISGNEW